MRTAETIEREKADREAPDSSGQTVKHPKTKHLAPYQWKPGQSGNPGGRKVDLAKQIARAVFEQNEDAAISAFAKILRKGNAYAFKELADRAYGKVTDKLEVTEKPPTDDADLTSRIAQLERDLGLAREIDEAGRAGLVAAGTGSPPSSHED
jgi:hypothetical protein